MLWALAPSPIRAQSEVDLGIETNYANRIPLSLFPFEALDGTRPDDAKVLEQIVQGDLEFSGLFKMYHGRPPLAHNGDDEGLIEVRGALAVHRGAPYFEGRVIDAGTGRAIGGKRYKVEPEQLRQIAHHFSDEVVRMLTGELGIATTRVIYRRRTGENWELVICDYDGYNPQVILRQSVPVMYPRWADKSKAVIYTSFRHGKPDLFLRYLQEKTSKRIVSFEGINYSVAWSPRRNELAATLSKDGNAEIYLLDSAGNVKRRLTHSRAIDTSPSWAPSGREIIFTSDRLGNPHLFIMADDGSNVRRLTFAGDYNDTACWSPKGDLIAFAARVDGFFQLCTIRPDGSNLRLLTNEPVNHEDPRWAPNGRHLVYSEEVAREKSISIIDTVTRGKRILAQGETPDWSIR